MASCSPSDYTPQSPSDYTPPPYDYTPQSPSDNRQVDVEHESPSQLSSPRYARTSPVCFQSGNAPLNPPEQSPTLPEQHPGHAPPTHNTLLSPELRTVAPYLVSPPALDSYCTVSYDAFVMRRYHKHLSTFGKPSQPLGDLFSLLEDASGGIEQRGSSVDFGKAPVSTVDGEQQSSPYVTQIDFPMAGLVDGMGFDKHEEAVFQMLDDLAAALAIFVSEGEGFELRSKLQHWLLAVSCAQSMLNDFEYRLTLALGQVRRGGGLQPLV